MSNEEGVTFSTEEISAQARLNFNAVCFAIIAYLNEHGMSIEDAWTFLGRRAAPSWQQGSTAEQAARGAAFNMVSAGFELLSLSGGETQAEAKLTGWPSAEHLEFFGVTLDDADASWINAFGAIFEHLGFNFKWRRQGDEVTITISS